MKKRKLFWTSVGLLIFGYASLHSQSITINEKGGTKTSYKLKEIRKITFSDNDLIINKKIGTLQTITSANFLFAEFQDISTGVSAVKKESGTLISYPNPTSKLLTVEIPATHSANVEISLLSLEGKVLYNTKIMNAVDKKSIMIDMAKFANGIYLCKVQSGGIINTKKIVKK